MVLSYVLAALALVAPADNDVLPTHTPGQKAYLKLPRAERIAKFADENFRVEMCKIKWYPQPVDFSWSDAAEGPVTFKVTRESDGSVFFTTNFCASAFSLDNFEIGATYRWTVTDSSGASLERRFSTESDVPRFLRVERVPNVRDLGGRRGLNGRRVRQNRVIRSAGLNENAGRSMASDEELARLDPDGKGRARIRAMTEYRNRVKYYRDHEVAEAIVPVTIRSEYLSDDRVRFELTTEKDGVVYLSYLANHGFTLSREDLVLRNDVRAGELLVFLSAGKTVFEAQVARNHADFMIRLRPAKPTQSLCDLAKHEAGELRRAIDRANDPLQVDRAGATRIGPWNRGFWLQTLGIRSDIDLRSDGETKLMNGSPLGDTVTWFHYSSGSYGQMKDDWAKAAFSNVFRVFLDEKNYPIDFHCIAGQDRTGAVAFILNALLGVEEDELYKDWESTGFWNPAHWFRHESVFNHLVAVFDAYPGETINARVEAYVRSLGFSADDITHFRNLMLEGE